MLLAPPPRLQTGVQPIVEQGSLGGEIPPERGKGRGKPEGATEDGMADGHRVGMRVAEARTACTTVDEGVRGEPPLITSVILLLLPPTPCALVSYQPDIRWCRHQPEPR